MKIQAFCYDAANNCLVDKVDCNRYQHTTITSPWGETGHVFFEDPDGHGLTIWVFGSQKFYNYLVEWLAEYGEYERQSIKLAIKSLNNWI